MRDRFLEFIKKHALISQGNRVLLAVSGGVDSMVLLQLCYEADIKVGVAHCNFCLRGEAADADERLVAERCAELNVPFFAKSFATKDYAAQKGISTQMAARDLRYAWFGQLLKDQGYHVLATAHHLNDSFETVIHNLVRGTAISGLRGIRPKYDQIIRPLLDFTKEEIETWARSNQLLWREDASNQENYYKRNFIRNKVNPLLQEMNPDMLSTFRDTAARNAEVERHFMRHVAEVRKEAVKEEQGVVSLLKIAVSEPYLLSQLLKPYGFNYSQSKEIISAYSVHSGRQFLSANYELTVDREKLLIERRGEVGIEPFLISDISQGDLQIGKAWYTVQKSSIKPDKSVLKEANALLDYDRLTFPLMARPWKEGDQFQPLGMKGKKKLSDFMIDRKIAVNLKKHVWVLESAGHIVWVAGLRVDDRFKVTDSTQTIFSLIRRETDV